MTLNITQWGTESKSVKHRTSLNFKMNILKGGNENVSQSFSEHYDKECMT